MIVALPGLFSYFFFTISVIVCLGMYVLVKCFILDSLLAIYLFGAGGLWGGGGGGGGGKNWLFCFLLVVFRL